MTKLQIILTASFILITSLMIAQSMELGAKGISPMSEDGSDVGVLLDEVAAEVETVKLRGMRFFAQQRSIIDSRQRFLDEQWRLVAMRNKREQELRLDEFYAHIYEKEQLTKAMEQLNLHKQVLLQREENFKSFIAALEQRLKVELLNSIHQKAQIKQSEIQNYINQLESTFDIPFSVTDANVYFK